MAEKKKPLPEWLGKIDNWKSNVPQRLIISEDLYRDLLQLAVEREEKDEEEGAILQGLTNRCYEVGDKPLEPQGERSPNLLQESVPTFSEEDRRILEEVYDEKKSSQDVNKRNEALKTLRSLPKFPGSVLAQTSLTPEKEDEMETTSSFLLSQFVDMLNLFGDHSFAVRSFQKVHSQDEELADLMAEAVQVYREKDKEMEEEQGKLEEERTQQEPVILEVVAEEAIECRAYKTPEHLQGVPWTVDISPSYLGRVVPHILEGQDRAYHLDFEICTSSWDSYWEGNGENYEVVAEGTLKWDGCMNVAFCGNYQRFCSPDDADALNQAIKWVWSQGKLLETWSGDF